MRTIAFVLIILQQYAVIGADIPKEDNVWVLTGETIDRFIAENTYALIEFYAPWCGHCKALEPHYSAAAAALEQKGSKTQLAKADATSSQYLSEAFGVSGFPTIAYYVNGTRSEYTGPREEAGIVEWIWKREMGVLETLRSEKAVQEFKEKGNFVIIGYFIKNSKRGELYDNVAKNLAESVASFGLRHVKDKESVRLVMVRNEFKDMDDETEIEFKGKWNFEQISNWILDSQYPTIGFNLNEKHKKIEYSLLLLMTENIDSASKDEELKSVLLKWEKKFREADKRLLIIFHDINKIDPYSSMYGNLKPGEVLLIDKKQQMVTKPDPRFREINPLTELKSRIEKQDAASVDALLQLAFDGNAPLYEQSEVVDLSEQKHAKILAASDYPKLIAEEHTDYLIEYYAPWCGHCTELAPVYEQLAEMMQLRYKGKVEVAKIDATKNDHLFPVHGFPHIVFLPAGEDKLKRRIDFKGPNTIQEMEAFIERHLSVFDDVKEEL
eukprot:GHVL01008460.1.p1 GENE.GHVL01008460.1~~GHVL01008460.1.p1  ORF type:complete len:496 (+),score=92.18 GHVL01008460.1:37-1524(+)